MINKCPESIEELTYFVSEGNENVKIGKSSKNNIVDRLSALQTGNPRNLIIELLVFSNEERFFHDYFRNSKIEYRRY